MRPIAIGGCPRRPRRPSHAVLVDDDRADGRRPARPSRTAPDRRTTASMSPRSPPVRSSPPARAIRACRRRLPIGSDARSLVHTAILARTPGRVPDLMTKQSLLDLRTSNSNSFITNSGEVRTGSPAGRGQPAIFCTKARTRSPMRSSSFGIISLRGRRASTLPISMIRVRPCPSA